MELPYDEGLWMRRLSAGDVALYLTRKTGKERVMHDKPDIYFVGSITSGRDDQPIYAEIIQMLSAYGRVLMSHGGDTQR